MYPATIYTLTQRAVVWTSQLSDHCKALADPNFWTTALAVFVVTGILFSYFPQLNKIIKRRSSEGLSPWWVLLGGVSSIAAAGNIATLPASRADVKCCKEISGGACAAALLGVTQIGIQWTCFMILVILYLAFYQVHESAESGEQDLSASTATLTPSEPSRSFDTIIVGCTNFVVLFVVGLTSVVLVTAFPHRTQAWADFLGIVSGILATVQYLPQIYHTWVLKDLKSLSVLTLLVQAPGSFVFALSLALRLGASGWSTWLVYVITGSLQIVLLLMAASFWLQQKKNDTKDVSTDGSVGDADNAPNERSALLQQQT